MGVMGDRQSFIAGMAEKQILFAHIYDLAYKSFDASFSVYGDFLSESEQSELILRKRFLPCDYSLFGGYEDAERKMVAFTADWDSAQFPIAAVKIIGHFSKLSHRDFLGSMMGLGIKREKCGDILISSDVCYVFTNSEIAPFIADNLLSVGREGVSCSVVPINEVQVPQREFTQISGTVATLRLDAILALFVKTGRANTADLINGGRVFVNGICASKKDMHLSDGDVLSVRGTGKGILEIGQVSRKGRIFVKINKYV